MHRSRQRQCRGDSSRRNPRAAQRFRRRAARADENRASSGPARGALPRAEVLSEVREQELWPQPGAAQVEKQRGRAREAASTLAVQLAGAREAASTLAVQLAGARAEEPWGAWPPKRARHGTFHSGRQGRLRSAAPTPILRTRRRPAHSRRAGFETYEIR